MDLEFKNTDSIKSSILIVDGLSKDDLLNEDNLRKAGFKVTKSSSLILKMFLMQ